MKTVAMIPIKLKNERVPNKNIKEFSDGTPLINFIQKVCLSAKKVDEVYVYCSSSDVEKYLLEGVKFLPRPEYLDGDGCNCNDIIDEFMRVVDADIYVASHATSPFTKPESIDICIDKVSSGHFDSAFLAKRLQEFLWQDGKPLNFDPQNFPRTQDLKPIYTESSGAFVFSKETFTKYKRRVGVKIYIHEVDHFEAIDIDYPIDFDIANAIYMGILRNENTN